MNIKELLIIELIKIQKRKAFWVTIGFYTFFGTLFLWIISQGALSVNGSLHQGFSLPDDWLGVLEQFNLFSTFYLPVTVILLSADEFANRTARQNIIDGLTREEYFLSKVILITFLSAVYLFIFVGLGLIFAAFKQNLSHSAIRIEEVKLFVSYFVLLIGYGTLALFFSFLTKNTANAIVLCLIYILIEAIASPLLSLKDVTAHIPLYLPTNIFDSLIEGSRFYQNQMQNNALLRPAINGHSTLYAWILTLLYIATINGAAFYSFKSRDL